MAAAKGKTDKPSLGIDDWVSCASATLATHGVDAVRVEPLARQLKVTKGSFYWHFSNRQELLVSVLNRWRKRATNAIIERLNESNLAPVDRLIQLFMFPKHGVHALEGANLEAAIRHWAKTDALAKDAVDEVDGLRIQFIEGIYRELGVSHDHANKKAILFYSTLQGISNISSLVDDEVLAYGKQLILTEFSSASGSEENAQRDQPEKPA